MPCSDRKLTTRCLYQVVYGIFLSFGELGPGNCLGLLAAKSSPTAVRGQFYGIAAAIGKVGGMWQHPDFELLQMNDATEPLQRLWEHGVSSFHSYQSSYLPPIFTRSVSLSSHDQGFWEA